MAEHHSTQLIQGILSMSESELWSHAKIEWNLVEIYREEEAATCLCGHYPIIEVCVLQNRKNGNTAEVGNICVKKFMGLESEKIFSGIRRISRDEDKSLSLEAIYHAYSKAWIDSWERSFCLDTIRKRKLSDRQLGIRRRINRTVLANLSRKKKRS
jgi:hypothetical protein